MKLLDEIKSFADDEQAINLSRFFKTGKGQYGEGDVFLGIKVPQTRSVAKKYYKDTDLKTFQQLLNSEFHEVRLLSLLMMVLKYEKCESKEIVDLYLKNVERINNWDLVDLSAPRIIGKYVYDKKEVDIIKELSESVILWANRIAVVSQLYPIKKGDFSLIIPLAEKFLVHKHDLMHKATGWMLREVGKVDENALYSFLDKHYKEMPRTMLRYSIEKLPDDKRAFYMKK